MLKVPAVEGDSRSAVCRAAASATKSRVASSGNRRHRKKGLLEMEKKKSMMKLTRMRQQNIEGSRPNCGKKTRAAMHQRGVLDVGSDNKPMDK
mmetsp:Transcript_116207/g.205507  ORF Transcript_116207/g.205507 Transcript_116207/m.205507 type:complete len:93 (+) Transcript_116207:956-1234(+)